MTGEPNNTLAGLLTQCHGDDPSVPVVSFLFSVKVKITCRILQTILTCYPYYKN